MCAWPASGDVPLRKGSMHACVPARVASRTAVSVYVYVYGPYLRPRAWQGEAVERLSTAAW